VIAALNNKLSQTPEFIYGADGKITGYKTDIGGADTVFPFSSRNGGYVITQNGKGWCMFIKFNESGKVDDFISISNANNDFVKEYEHLTFIKQAAPNNVVSGKNEKVIAKVSLKYSYYEYLGNNMSSNVLSTGATLLLPTNIARGTVIFVE